jgi:hypothetical protein
MAKSRGLVKKAERRRADERQAAAYRAVTLGAQRGDWGVVDADGTVVFRGDARVAAMIASPLTRPGA